MDEDHDTRRLALERDVENLRSRLRRAQHNQQKLEEAKDRNDHVLHAVISDMERAQADLVTKNEELLFTQEKLRESERLARKASRAKTDFLARMSHELRTPLNAIIGYCELLLEDVRSTSDQSDLDRIRTAGQHLLSLINDVLDLSRIEAGRVEISHDPIHARSLVQELAATMDPLVREHGNSLEVDVQGDLEFVSDGTKLRQILLNLLGNAAKFTRDGQITLSVVAEEPGWVSFVVRDTGMGFAQEELDTLFEDFAQLAGPGQGGTGLGLAIARRFCHLLGGTIHGEGRRGHGARFVVRLPTASDGDRQASRQEDASVSAEPVADSTLACQED